jgi:hypothetical protein
LTSSYIIIFYFEEEYRVRNAWYLKVREEQNYIAFRLSKHKCSLQDSNDTIQATNSLKIKWLASNQDPSNIQNVKRVPFIAHQKVLFPVPSAATVRHSSNRR